MRYAMCLKSLVCGFIAVSLLVTGPLASAREAQLKGLGRFDGWRENSLIGYGIVVGLSGSGDSRRSVMTQKALGNVLARLGTSVEQDDISSRNVAVVIVTGTLPPSANPGDRFSVTVSSAGDARSLSGGTLLMTPMLGPDRRAYALAQGALVTGGFSFESDLNLQQRNYPTSARLENGATVELGVESELSIIDGELRFLLNEPDFTTADRIATRVNAALGADIAWAKSADEVRIHYDGGERRLASFVARIETLSVEPDRMPRVVINERTGTIVAGGDVTISSVVISQGDIRISVTAENYASQPSFIGGLAQNVRSLVVTNTDLAVEEGADDVVAVFPSTSVADLAKGLHDVNIDTRRIISILQAMKEAGALHAEIIIQ